jgi:hypothetical protein
MGKMVDMLNPLSLTHTLRHFVILFFVLNFGFIALGMAQFASEKEEFSTPLRSFETLWEMLLGSMIESGAIPSSTWSYNTLIMLYLIFYNFFIFMCARTHKHTSTHQHTSYKHTHTNTHTHTCTRTYTHKHIHMHTRTHSMYMLVSLLYVYEKESMSTHIMIHMNVLHV